MQLRSLPAEPNPTVETRGDLVFLFPPKTRWIALLQVVRPTSWLMPMWAMLCGMMTNEDIFQPSRALVIALALLAIGPLQGIFLGYARAFFGRDTEALRFPEISNSPSLDVSVIVMAISLMGIALSGHWLGTLPLMLTFGGLLLGVLRELNPVQIRRLGSIPTLGALVSVGIPWFIGEALCSSFSFAALIPGVIFTFGYVGLAILFDISRIEEDRIRGIHSLGALLGADLGMWLAAFVIDTAVLGAAILCMGSPTALFLLTILLLQVLMQGIVLRYGRPDWYFPLATLLFALGMMLAATTSHISPIQL